MSDPGDTAERIRPVDPGQTPTDRSGRRYPSILLTEEGLMAKKGKKTKRGKQGDGTTLIASYKRAHRDYDVGDAFEAGPLA